VSIFVGLGSNLGDREHFLREAVKALSRIDAVSVTRCSSLYDSAPVGPPQPRYLNAVVELECDLEPQRLLGILKQIEMDLGRRREGKWTARPIDLDILLWNESVIADPNLQIPHLELHKRRFALEPLNEIAPQSRHPLLGNTVENLLSALGHQDVIRVDSAPEWCT
jgi:2-amino-4-hydroxy-6-hydroxymethyldihydropteridine diphosphokinase